MMALMNKYGTPVERQLTGKTEYHLFQYSSVLYESNMGCSGTESVSPRSKDGKYPLDLWLGQIIFRLLLPAFGSVNTTIKNWPASYQQRKFFNRIKFLCLPIFRNFSSLTSPVDQT
jgi:hypothetical protein